MGHLLVCCLLVFYSFKQLFDSKSSYVAVIAIY